MTESDWTAPASAVLDALGERLDAGDPAVLATVVDVEGTAYRRPGAKMVVDPDGSGVGTVTAGCLEPTLLADAEAVLEAGEPRVERYDLSAADGDAWGMGVGCDGVVEVLLEPVGPTLAPAVAAHRGDGPVVAATVVASPDVTVGERFYFHPTEPVDADVGDPPYWLRTGVQDVGAELVAGGGATTVDVDTRSGFARVYVEVVRPPTELLVVGDGHDAEPLVELAAENDFRVTVVGFRGAEDLDARFPDAHRTLTTAPADLASALSVDADTHAVVMTHNFVDDRLALEALVDAGAGYVGLMGPADRFEEVLAAAEAEGRPLDESALERVYAPVGLDLGARTPAQVATSIVAELLAVRSGREPQHLAERDGAIHDRVELDPSATGE